MTEKDTQQTTSPEASDETKNTDTNSEVSIPKTRFDEVNEERKQLEARLKEIEEKQAEEEKKKLEEKESYKELTERLKKENEELRISGIRRDKVQEAINNKELHPKLAHLVSGNTEEDIVKSIENAKSVFADIQETVKSEHTASDDGGANRSGKAEEMSTQEWMELYKKDPEKADQILKEETERRNK